MLIMHSILSVLCNTLSYVLLYKLLAATTTADTLVSRAKFINFVLHYCGLHFLILAVNARGRMKLDENYDRICNTSGANIRKIYIPRRKRTKLKLYDVYMCHCFAQWKQDNLLRYMVWVIIREFSPRYYIICMQICRCIHDGAKETRPCCDRFRKALGGRQIYCKL